MGHSAGHDIDPTYTFLYVSCWGTGELKQYDVSDPAHPREVGSVGSAASRGARRTPRRLLSGSPTARRWSR